MFHRPALEAPVGASWCSMDVIMVFCCHVMIKWMLLEKEKIHLQWKCCCSCGIVGGSGARPEDGKMNGDHEGGCGW